MYTLPKTIDVPTPAHRTLDLSNILFAVTNLSGDVVALFRWFDRAEDYLKTYDNVGYRIINIKTGL